ncbi:MAG: hypothetical protein HY301_14275 [Verrucomicrobia bacterium]|nr:hypothetical protein [Verrucomicrobiota bacterium]
MSKEADKLQQLILQLENYIECWKQFNHYLTKAREKRFDADDESQFLDCKCVITQELEAILDSVECTDPTKEDIHALMTRCPSLSCLSEQQESVLRQVENQWHKIYIAWQSILGQLKVAMRKQEDKGGWSFSLFGKKKEA